MYTKTHLDNLDDSLQGLIAVDPTIIPGKFETTNRIIINTHIIKNFGINNFSSVIGVIVSV